MFKRLIFLTSFLLVLALVGTNVALGSVVDIRIATGDDDVEERLREDRNGDLDMGSSDLELAYEDFDPLGDPQRVSMRFIDVGIPQGAQITSAYIEFEVDNLKGGTAPVNVIIDGELTPDAAPFVDVSFNVSNRPSWTTEVVKWSVPEWTEKNVKYQTPDISVLVQEIVNQDGWAYGNAMVYTVQDDPENPSEGVREAESYNGEADAAPLLHVEFISKVAMQPVPADGAIEVDAMTLEWTPADVAVSNKVYLSTDETIDESDLAGETAVALIAPAIEPGTTYYWRVDEVEADGTVTEGKVWSFSTLPLEAHFPSPEDGARDVAVDAQLSWTAGKDTIMHNVYFGTDPAALPPVSMMQMDTSYDPGPLEPFMTYYWKVDEFTPMGTAEGPVWSFDTTKYIVISDDEVTLDYDNSIEPFLSEVALDTPADLTREGVSDLTLKLHGGPGPEGSASIDEATGTYTITGSGADIWGTSDQFHYVYVQLTGDAEIIVRCLDNGEGTNNWAKGGPMIRETLEPGSKFAAVYMTTPANGVRFQKRADTDGSASSDSSVATDEQKATVEPVWLKLVRTGNEFNAFYSLDPATQPWVNMSWNPQTVEMAESIYIGAAVTSHQSGEKRTFTFDNVDITGNITADIASQDIGIPFNTPEPIYVALEDSSGAVASVYHGNPEATMIDQWRDWTIPLSKFSGVDPSSAVKLYIGVGDGEPGGSGTIRADDIRVVKPDVTAAIASWEAAVAPAAPGFLATNVPDDLYDIGQFSGDITYEFVVRSNPDETEASMCLIGRRQFGDTQAGLKFDQWNNTGEYGATLFGVVDLYYGIANHPGVDTHLVFVSSEDASTTALYVNGVYQASVDRAITLFGLVGIGYGAQGEDGSGAFDDFDGDIFGVAIYDAALSDGEIAAHSDAFFAPLADVTLPGDIVKGVPDDGDWPGAEYPDLAIDDNTGKKYLHFKGDFDVGDPLGGAGFQVTPLEGASIVTGLTFTTANDCPERDPVAFGLYGSNVSIDGPYEMIAIGDIVDFAQETAWPRYTKNETPISFDNDVAYEHYQVLFLAIRDVGSANSMQIAEVELLGVLAP